MPGVVTFTPLTILKLLNRREFEATHLRSPPLLQLPTSPLINMPHRVRSPDDPTARMRLAARAGKLSVLQKLLSREPSWRINEAREEDGWTALHLACFWGHIDCVKTLIRAGAAVDQRDVEGRTALHMACLYGEAEAVKVLLKAKAEKNLLAGRAGKTALEFAIESGSSSCATLLAEHVVPIPPAEGTGRRSDLLKSLDAAVVLDTPLGRACKRPLTDPTVIGMHLDRRRPESRRATKMPKLSDGDVIILS